LRIIAVIFILLVISSEALAATPHRAVVLVFPIEDTTKTLAVATLDGFHDFLAAEIGRRPRFSVLPRGEVRSRLVSEKAETYKACYDDACQIEIGKELSANKVVATRISALGSKCLISSYLFDLASGASDTTATATSECSGDGLANVIVEIAKQLVGVHSDESAPAPGAWLRGLTLAEIERSHIKRFKLVARRGLVVTAVAEGSTAQIAGVKAGDVLHSIGVADAADRSTDPIRTYQMGILPDVLQIEDSSQRTFYLKIQRGRLHQTIELRPQPPTPEVDKTVPFREPRKVFAPN
jgi:hypothetical protein